MTSLRRLSGTLALLCAATGAIAADELGRVHYRLPGQQTLDARPTWFEAGAVVLTLDEPAVVHLDNGQVLRLDPNTAIKLDAAGDDDVKVSVLSGRTLQWAAKGGALEAGAGSWFVLGPSLASPLVVEALLLAEPALPAGSRDRGRDRQDSSKSAITGR